MRSLLLYPVILLICSMGMNCAAMDDSPKDREASDRSSMDTTTTIAEAVDCAQMNFSSQESSEHDETTWKISLLGCERILLPGTGRIPRAGEISQELISPEGLAIYSQGMPVQGRIEMPDGDPHEFVPSGSTVCIAPLNLSAFLAGDPGKGPLLRESIYAEVLEWEGTDNDGAAKRANLSFSIPEDKMAGKRSGLYAVYALDRNRSMIVPAQAIFLTEGEAVLQAEDIILWENQSIRINLSIGREDGHRKLFAAAIMPRKEYDNATIMLVANESGPRPVLALSSGSRSMEIEANPATLQGQLMDLISLLPENSAVSMQEATQSAVDLILLTDGGWEKGEYVINCAIYCPGMGVAGLKQKFVEVV